MQPGEIDVRRPRDTDDDDDDDDDGGGEDDDDDVHVAAPGAGAAGGTSPTRRAFTRPGIASNTNCFGDCVPQNDAREGEDDETESDSSSDDEL
jgi:hypothetical protein